MLGMNTEGLIKKEKPWWQQALLGANEQGQNMVGTLIKLLPMLL